MPTKYIKQILEARVYDVATQTPVDEAHFLSTRLDNRILLKREDLQPVYSFKLRGAYNHMVRLSPEQRALGVIAASAGNHAQGVAYSAQKLGIRSVIVMPETTPDTKVRAVRSFGSKALLHGDTFDEACAYATTLAEEKGYSFIHPYDDSDVIAGQGTIGMELLRQVPDQLDAIFVPVGGGGLIAGVGAFVKYLRPKVKIIGVEAEDSACLAAALEKNRRVVLPEVGIFADGVAVAQIGKETFRLAKRCVDEVITVNTDEICASIKDVFDDTRSITEPAGALAVAGLKKYVQRENASKQTLVAINSGANTNFDRLRHISERAELGENREAILAVTIPEIPGSFRRFCKLLGKINISEFNYRYSDNRDAQVFAGVQIRSATDREAIVQRLRDKNYATEDLSDNEMAKLHIRHMVGGRHPEIGEELLYRVEFPERPGALMAFLINLGEKWNISLFHYRNHGAAYGRVLVGFQASKRDGKEIEAVLRGIGYRFYSETSNPAYELFLK